MKITLRRSRPRATTSDGFLRRIANQLGGGLVPAPVLVPVGGPFPERRPASDRFHPVFGRRRDEGPHSDSPEEPEANSDEVEAESSPPLVPPAPSMPEESAEEEPVEAETTEDLPVAGASPVESSWTGYEPEPVTAEPSPFSFEPSPERQDLPAWTPSPLTESAFPVFPAEPEEPTGGPWSTDATSEVVAFPGNDYREETSEEPTWPATSEGQLWSPPVEEPSSELPEAILEATPSVDELPESEFTTVGEEAPEEEPPVVVEAVAGDEVPADDAELAIEQVVAEEEVPAYPEAEPAWAVAPLPEPEVEPVYVGYPQETAAAPYAGAVTLVEDARAFPLPEGDVLFRNLRAGFTDPARLLRHLAGEGHTGVLHVAAVDSRNTYVVLVDGYVVAVASDAQGRLTTTNRVSFPNFPNSQDILNVITYPREIARGLGLLLHAPVHFRGLGAMFVNLDGLRSYLSKHSASGGMVVASDAGTGVALFDDGRLVGAYNGNQAPESDLTPLRELIKDLDAEIDVRFGGPKDLDPIPLDTLLAGYPL